ncbi:glycosyltransferase family 4 protein [Hymenobacter sp. BT507]|uniref:Glycosyltransferase family 4 protein n=1 Tax=Hymenobacter citatus TaxID=2763506 RepID=A0ABR7MM68_9BACT|nr:glycosyltransferase family 4 protein [Hymenobacter citatus]MBC6611653.1 glycosyltransferase family 4 protein [Hymenobacter citatus]
MRIAFILTMGDAPWGGSEVLWSKTAALALQQGHAVFISTYRWPEIPSQLAALQQDGAILFRRPGYRADIISRITNRLRLVGKLRSEEVRAIESFAPDLLVINQGGAHDIIYREDLLPLLLSKQYRYCLLCHLYQDPIKLREAERNIITRVYANAQQVFAISRNQADVLQRQIATKLPHLSIVQNPINLPTQWPIAFPSSNVPQWAVVASLDSDRKGQDVLFEVLARPQWQERLWHLNLYGTGPDLAYLTKLATYYAIANRVTFKGHVADSGQIWAENHVLIIPSRLESGPMVLAEAMLSGRPVVATNVGMVKEWIQEGQNGFIAEASLPDSLDAALERCWTRQTDWEKIGQAAYAYAKPRVDFNASETMMNKFLALGK